MDGVALLVANCGCNGLNGPGSLGGDPVTREAEEESWSFMCMKQVLIGKNSLRNW
jgi:hypothetical protein